MLSDEFIVCENAEFTEWSLRIWFFLYLIVKFKLFLDTEYSLIFSKLVFLALFFVVRSVYSDYVIFGLQIS